MNMEPLFMEMIETCAGDPHQVQHFAKVHSFARRIGLGEQLDDVTQTILEVAAIVHDIGIKPSLAKYGSAEGKYQEQEGPPLAKAMLEKLRYPKDVADRVCFLVGRHHTLEGIDGLDYQILIEADYLVNIFEGNMDENAVDDLLANVFRTKTGTWICRTMFKHESGRAE